MSASHIDFAREFHGEETLDCGSREGHVSLEELDRGGELQRVPRATKAAVFAAILIASSSACGDETTDSGESGKEFVIGATLPFIDAPGGFVETGELAWNLVVDDINDHGGVLGKTLVVRNRTTETNATGGVEEMQELVDDGVGFFLGGMPPHALSAQMAVTVPASALLLSPLSDFAHHDEEARQGLVYRLTPDYEPIGRVAAEYFEAQGLTKLAVISDSREDAEITRLKTVLDTIEVHCESCEVQRFDFPAEGEGHDFLELGEAVKASHPDALYLVSRSSYALDVVQETHDPERPVPLYMAYPATASSYAELVPETQFESIRYFDYSAPASSSLSALSERFGEGLGDNPRQLSLPDAVMLIALAATKAGSDDPQMVAAALNEVAHPPGEKFGLFEFDEAVAAILAGNDIDFDGASGPLEFNELGDVTQGTVVEWVLSSDGFQRANSE